MSLISKKIGKVLRKAFLYLTAILILVALSHCSKNEENYSIPNVRVDEIVYINLPSNLNLKVVGGYIFLNSGYRGIVVYRRYNMNQADDFIAYEMACPEHHQQNCGLLEVDGGVYLNCPCTDHQFLLFDGAPLDNGSPIGVKPYSTVFDPFSNSISIKN